MLPASTLYDVQSARFIVQALQAIELYVEAVQTILELHHTKSGGVVSTSASGKLVIDVAASIDGVLTQGTEEVLDHTSCDAISKVTSSMFS